MRFAAFILPCALAVMISAGATLAAPKTSLYPRPRPDQTVSATDIDRIEELVAIARLKPRMRPVSPQENVVRDRPETLAFLSPDISLRPGLRPDSIVRKALSRKRKLRRGAVCGSFDIQGEEIGRVPGKINGCGVAEAVKITSVSGVTLSQAAIMDCDTARALNKWVVNGAKPAFRRRGPLVSMRVAAHYACRTRNNQPGARISEHGKGKAIDISAFTMMDGEVITVAEGWGRGTTLKPLRQAWKSACGPFGTVLGPAGDRYHRDHFHLDTASYRSGPFCR